MDATLMQKMIEQVELADAIATRAEKMASAKEAKDKEVESLVPKAVDELTKNACISEDERVAAKCAALLRDPATALEVLINTAKLVGQYKKSAAMGTEMGGTTKKAAVRGSLASPYVGVRTSEERDSDRALLEKLGLR